MIVRSLFTKIFLWFWFSITIVIASLVLVTWLYPYSAVPSGTLPDRLHELQVRGALAVYESQGQQAFEMHRKMLDSASRLRTFYLDESGRELSDQSVPDSLLEFAREHKSELDGGDRVMAGQPSKLAIPVTGGSGKKYLALVQGGRSRGFGPPPTPGDGAASRPNEFMRDGDRGGGPVPNFARDGGGGENDRGGRGGPGGGGGGGGRGGPPRMPESTPRFELLVPANVLLLRLLAVVLAAGLGCYLLARYLTSPVRQLQNAARQLAAGDLGTRVGKRLRSRGDEIGELGRDFDRMADQVETLLTTQRRLLQDVSHELRSPLARLNVALELAARDAGHAAGPALARVGREADRLNDLIGQLLTLARLEAGAAQPQHMPVDFAALVNEVASDADFEAGACDRRVRVVRADACKVVGDSTLLRSAIENIMRNAVHHTAVYTEVLITLSERNSDAGLTIDLEVRDHGPGVPVEALASIFQPFYRVSDARDRKTGGAGLGLAIADRAIRLHGGSVSAINAPEGGLIIRMTLPAAGQHAS